LGSAYLVGGMRLRVAATRFAARRDGRNSLCVITGLMWAKRYPMVST
jgi:hypothetical protein